MISEVKLWQNSIGTRNDTLETLNKPLYNNFHRNHRPTFTFIQSDYIISQSQSVEEISLNAKFYRG